MLAPLAALVGFEAERVASRAKSTAVTYGLMAAFGLVGIGFLVGAGYIALAAATSPLVASLIMGGVFILLALAVYLGIQIGEDRRKREAVERKHSNDTSAFVTTAALTALPALAKSPMMLRFGIPAAIVAFLLMRDRD